MIIWEKEWDEHHFRTDIYIVLLLYLFEHEMRVSSDSCSAAVCLYTTHCECSLLNEGLSECQGVHTLPATIRLPQDYCKLPTPCDSYSNSATVLRKGPGVVKRKAIVSPQAVRKYFGTWVTVTRVHINSLGITVARLLERFLVWEDYRFKINFFFSL